MLSNTLKPARFAVRVKGGDNPVASTSPDWSAATRVAGSPEGSGDRRGKYSGSDDALDLDRKVGQGPTYGLGNRRAQAHCRRRNAGEVRQHADAFF